MQMIPGTGATVKNQRRARGWSQERLAEIASVGLRTVQRLEQHDQASVNTLKSIAGALGIHPDELTSARGESSDRAEKVELLPRIADGTQLAAVIGGSEAFQSDHPVLTNEAEVTLVADFLQYVQDIGEIWNDLRSGDHVRESFRLTEELQALESAGFAVYGARIPRPFSFAIKPTKPFMLSVGVVAVRRLNDPHVVNTDAGEYLPAIC